MCFIIVFENKNIIKIKSTRYIVTVRKMTLKVSYIWSTFSTNIPQVATFVSQAKCRCTKSVKIKTVLKLIWANRIDVDHISNSF